MKVRLIVSLFLFVGSAAAQMTTVSGTVIDPNGVPYARGTISAVLILPGGQSPTLNGQPYTPPTQPVGLDTTGSFSFNIADNTQLQPGGTQWNFTVCSAVGTLQPVFGTASQCFTLPAPITISGSSQSITSNLHAAALALTLPFSGGSMTGCVVSPATNNGIVWINLGNCTSGANLEFFPSGSLLIVGQNGSAAPAVIRLQANTTANFVSLAASTDAKQASLGFNGQSTPLIIETDASINPKAATMFGAGLAGSAGGGFGFEFVTCGDTCTGSGNAVGFVVKNNPSTTNTSAGAPVTLNAGAAQGLSNSPGGAIALNGGNSSGTNTGNPGGPVSLTAGTASGGNNRGGDVTIQAGNGVGTGRGGNINLNIGTGSPNGQVLCNGTPCFPGVLTTPIVTTCSSCPVSIANSNTTIISQSITFPGLGCPCRILVTYSLYLTTTTSGQDAAMVQDNTTQCSGAACVMATAQTATTGSASGFGIFGSGFSPTTYANGQTVIFSVVAASTHASGTTAVAAVAPSLTGAQSSYVNIAVLGSN